MSKYCFPHRAQCPVCHGQEWGRARGASPSRRFRTSMKWGQEEGDGGNVVHRAEGLCTPPKLRQSLQACLSSCEASKEGPGLRVSAAPAGCQSQAAQVFCLSLLSGSGTASAQGQGHSVLLGLLCGSCWSRSVWGPRALNIPQ